MRRSASAPATPTDIPAIIRENALIHRLGPPQAVYQPANIPILQRISSPACLVVGCLLSGLFFFFYNPAISWRAQWQLFILPVMGIGWLALGLWIMLSPLRDPPTRVYLCPRGLIYVAHDATIIRWQQIRRFWKDLRSDEKGQMVSTYRLLRGDKKQFLFTNELSHIDVLGRSIESRVVQRLLPRAIIAYNARSLVDFDELLISWQGIVLHRQQVLLPWKEVDRVVIDNRTIQIYRVGETKAWETIGVPDVPNVAVLRGLIEHARHEFERSQSPHILIYKAGQPVFFGPLSISRQGIQLSEPKELLPWSEIAGIGVGASEVIIKRGSKKPEWHVLPLWMIPHAPALKNLIEYIVQGRI